MSVIEKTLQQALKMLDAVGATYKVVMPSGAEYGVLECVKPKLRQPRSRIFAETGYIDKLRDMNVGEVEVLTPPAGTEAEEMRSAVCGTAFRLWGKGAFKTAITDHKVEVLRIQ